MPPSEDFSQKRIEAEELIRQHAPVGLQEHLISLLRPSVALNAVPADDAQIPVGASKFGGAPDVPEDFEWPMWNGKPLGFLGQINLGEVAPFDCEGLLPREGTLWFFVSLGEGNRVGGEPEHFEGWRVLFGDEPLHRLPPPANSHWISRIAAQRVGVGAGWSLDGDALDWEEEDDGWYEFQWQVLEVPPHRMLSTPYSPQLSPFVIAANGSQGKNWLALYDEEVPIEGWDLLLQLNTGANGFFVEDGNDLGWLYFMIRREDLKKGDFSRVWHNSQST